jgi:hypothetical protein
VLFQLLNSGDAGRQAIAGIWGRGHAHFGKAECPNGVENLDDMTQGNVAIGVKNHGYFSRDGCDSL